MTAPDALFVQHCLELLGSAGQARARRMFGGHGLYVDGLFVALILGDTLYLKADESTRERFEGSGSEAFAYVARGKSVRLGFYSAPNDAMDSPALMQPWTRLAMAAALRAQASRAPRRNTKETTGRR